MSDAALTLFNRLNSWADLQQLIDNGEAEGLFLECKNPAEPKLNRDLQGHLARALSGFSNTAGGIIIWGMNTTRHSPSKLDIITEIEPIGSCANFKHQIETATPSLTTPSIMNIQLKTIRESTHHTKGIVVTYIPKTLGDPIQVNKDHHQFYFRNGAEFTELPYEMLKRLFAATESPDLYPVFDSSQVTLEANGQWKIPVVIQNLSSAVAQHTTISAEIINVKSCNSITCEGFKDVSDINPGKKMFILSISGVIHRGMNIIAGKLIVEMAGNRRPKRLLNLSVALYADKMRARKCLISLVLAKKGCSYCKYEEDFLY